jgi:hypothetical protein
LVLIRQKQKAETRKAETLKFKGWRSGDARPTRIARQAEIGFTGIDRILPVLQSAPDCQSVFENPFLG